ncbi:MAG: N-formylglutamate amidohydrolase [Alphaproteobacteria bacterium]
MSAILVSPPEVTPVPLVVTVPHAGQRLTPEMTATLRVPPAHLRQLEDPWVDRLLAGVPAHGAWLVATRWARAVADANRAADEFAFAGTLAGWRASGKARLGLGVVPTRIAGAPIYAKPLEPAAVEARVALAHAPYHAALAQLVAETHGRFGEVFVIDAHSMPDNAQSGALPMADVVLGDRWGRAAETAWTTAVAEALGAEGLTTTRNRPYAGGYITRRYGRPEEGVHVVQVEFRRGLYMDETRFAPLSTFDDFRERLCRVIANLAVRLAARPPTAFALAGE